MSRTRPFISNRGKEGITPQRPQPIRPHLIDKVDDKEPTHYGAKRSERALGRTRKCASGRLLKWLRAQVNRPWDKVFSEVCDKVDRVIINEDVLNWMVYVNVLVEDSKVYDKTGTRYGVMELHDVLYVDRHGILKLSKPRPRYNNRPPQYLLREGKHLYFVACNGQVYEFEEDKSRPKDWPSARRVSVKTIDPVTGEETGEEAFSWIEPPVPPVVRTLDVRAKVELGYGTLSVTTGWEWSGRRYIRLAKIHDERIVDSKHIKATCSKMIERLRPQLLKLEPVPYTKFKADELARTNRLKAVRKLHPITGQLVVVSYERTKLHS